MRRSSGTLSLRAAMPRWIATAHWADIRHACELDKQAIARRPDEAPLILPDGRVDQCLTMVSQGCAHRRVIRLDQPAIADDIRAQVCGEPSLGSLRHGPP